MIKKTLCVAALLIMHTADAMPAPQEAQAILLELGAALGKHKEQNSGSIDHMEAALETLQSLLEAQQAQCEQDAKTIIELRVQLDALEKQSAQDIAVLEEQLVATNAELELLEDEYSQFVDASFAYLQGFFTQLQMAKQAYNGMVDERNIFSTTLQQLACTVETQA